MRLSTAGLARLPQTIKRPAYDRVNAKCGIVHLGVGAFHRAHQAVYTDAVLSQSGGDWMITGASLQTPHAGAELNPQNGLFSVLAEDDQQVSLAVIGAIREVLFAPADPQRLVSRIANPNTRIVSLTITEKGYCRDPVTGALLLDHVRADFAHPTCPTTALGFLARALQQRRSSNAKGLSILSCDNLPDNGRATRRVLLEFADQMDPALARWIEENVTFPSSMVDRIVPAVTDSVRDRVSALLGLDDQATVATEPFSQWVIEDDFCQGRPAWEQAGAIFTESVAPFETMKLRLLNGAHSAIAYLGHLAGHTFVAECMADDRLRYFISTMMTREILPAIMPPPGFSIEDYIQQLEIRFCNSKLRHRCLQIATDGSQKIPQRLLSTITERIAQHQDISHLAMAVAAWMIFVTGHDLNGNPHEINDPLATRLRARTRHCIGKPDELVSSLLQLTPVFAPQLRQTTQLRQVLIEQVTSLYRHGVHGALNRLHGKR